MKIEVLGPERGQALEALFEAAACACYCRYFHFEGNKNAWLERCAFRPEENARELGEALAREEASARGLVALDGDSVIGWIKLTSRATLPKLTQLAVYKGLDVGGADSTTSVGCFLVHPAHRGRGVARALLDEACRVAASWGARAIEGYPRRSSDPLHPEEAWQGPERVFQELGFQAIEDFPQYPVYRKALS